MPAGTCDPRKCGNWHSSDHSLCIIIQSATDSHNILINESVLCVCGVSLKHKCLALDVKYSLSDYLPGDR